MMGRSFRFCQYRIEWNYFSADLADHADADRTLSFRPRSGGAAYQTERIGSLIGALGSPT
jgi:hypothetical protein